jgi:hypothetical protein
VEATFKERRNKVESKSNDGKEDRSSGFRMYIPTRRMIRDKVILNERNRSSNMAGMGMTMTMRMDMAAKPMRTSVLVVTKANRLRVGLCGASSITGVDAP